jgi:hypothetical protein
VDFPTGESQKCLKLPPPMPFSVSRLLPPAQMKRVLRYYGAYADDIERLEKIALAMPKIGKAGGAQEPTAFLHYFTGTADYFIYEYDGEDTMRGKAHFNVYPAATVQQKFSLSNLKSRPFMELDFCWDVPGCQT